MPSPTTIVWFRHDLRLGDNPALRAALERGGPVLPLYIGCPNEEGDWAPGGASRWWLHQSLAGLRKDLEKRGSGLVIRRGGALRVLRDVIRSSGADAVYWNRRYEPAAIARDTAVKKGLRGDGIEATSFNGSLLFEPWQVQTRQEKPYQVFTPFWKTCLTKDEPADPLPTPRKIPGPGRPPDSDDLDDLALEPEIDWAGGMRTAWTPGEKGAARELNRFLESALTGYDDDRDRPDRVGTSRLSPHLHFGEISPRTVWHAVKEEAAASGARGVVRGADAYLREIGWREFAHHLLYHFPHTPEKPLREAFQKFPWKRSKKNLAAWQKGLTGYPIVDAGMRQLWKTGWMHNRVRMIAASFLVKDLLLPWQDGAAWFWDTLVDADLANNTLGWQWTAGCGADAAPFFRIFNPISQGQKFDPQGSYVREYVPELAGLPDKWIHKPWEAPDDVLGEAGLELGRDYPGPLVDHAEARDRALGAFDVISPPRGS